ncbi:MAG: AMP-binding protein [Thiotrichales bacterium]|nr:AMP-binding protein [Thiotrichales bacterium]
MERIWLESYTEGVPHDIDPDGYPSLVAIIDEAIARFPDRPAFENLGVRITFAELDRLAKDFTGYLASAGLGRGDRIALMMPNVLQYPVALVGALRAGLVVVNTNPLYTARELRHQLVDSGARAIVALENFGHVLEECIDDTGVERVVVTSLGDMLSFPKNMLVNFVVRRVKKLVPPFRIDGAMRWKDALSAGRNAAAAGAVELAGEDLAFLQYTGGTTGVAKGAMLTHRNMVANVLQVDGFLRPFAREGEEVVITALPLYHIFALAVNCLTYMRFGALGVLVTNPRDMPGFVRILKGVRFTAITGVNTLFNGLMNTRGFDQLDFSAMRISVGGGMAVQSAVAERWKEMTGVTLLEGYGLTETSPCVCMNPLHIGDFTGMIGVPMASTECRVVDEAGGALPVDTPGELCVRGPQVMRGYWKRPEETAAVLDDEGWLRTGDIAEMDARGFVRIVDRKKDMILVSGFNVYPNEVEEVVSQHPEVAEVGAIGVADELSGEAVKIVVVKRSPGLTEESLRAYCEEQLTGYKRPRHIEFTDALPKTNVGKILRRELRERFAGSGGSGA